MAVTSVSIRMEEEMLNKIAYIADYEGSSVNSQVMVLIRENINQRSHRRPCSPRIQCKTHPQINAKRLLRESSSLEKVFA